MKTLHTHNEEMEKEFEEEWNKSNDWGGGKFGNLEEGDFCNDEFVPDGDGIKNFITNSNKQLYIKIAEGEIERLTHNSIFLETLNVRDGYNIAIQDQINYWNNILQELNK